MSNETGKPGDVIPGEDATEKLEATATEETERQEAKRQAELEEARLVAVTWLKSVAEAEAEWSAAILESHSDPARLLRLAIKALEAKAAEAEADAEAKATAEAAPKAKAKAQGSAEKAKLERFALEVQDVLARLAADQAVRSS
jgi:nucleoid-associated protein YgaU